MTYHRHDLKKKHYFVKPFNKKERKKKEKHQNEFKQHR